MPRVRLDGGVIGVTNNPTSASAGGMWSMKDHEKFTRSASWPAATGAVPLDTYFNYNAILLHGNGTNAANNTVFVDGSTSAITLTTNGKPLQGTYSPFSQTGWSNYFDGTGDYVSTTSPGTAFQFGTSNWTIEAWVYPTATGTTQTVFQIYGTTIDNIQLQFNGTSKAFFCDFRATNQTLVTITSTVLATLNHWNHVVLTRDSTTTVKLYVNGSLGATQAIASTTTFTDTQFSGNPTIGAKTNTVGNYFTGYVSNLRVVSGSAVYTGAFTPPTSALSVITGTVLLTCQDNKFKDNSSNNFTLTNNADASVQPFSPFAPSAAHSNTTVGGSISFNGSTDYLSSTSTAFGVGSSSFTVEFWVYKNNVWSTGNQFIVDNGATNGMQIWVNTSAGALRLGRYGVDVILDYAYSSLTPNQWYHMAYVRSGTSVALFINGTRVATATSSASFLTSSVTQNIGRSTDTTNYWNGYISNLRVINGTAAYDPSQTTITVPTAPLTAVASTSLLLNATNAGIIDHTAKNVLTTYGSGSTISNTQSKFGTYSIYQDGTNSYVSIPSTALFNFGAGEFTIECWVYVTATNVRTAFFSKSNSAGTTVPFLLEMTSAGLPQGIAQDTGGQKLVTGGSALTTNTWTHLALVRSVNTLSLYKDGTSIGTPQTLSGALVTNTDEIRIGVNKFGSSSVAFYIDDIRVTAGVARYTSNFTPKTSAFEDQ